jgi:hypothetical protein
MRKLSQDFKNDLTGGQLKGFLDAVIDDTTLSLGIRDEYVNIYYRGGSLFKITPDKNGSYCICFDKKYMKPTNKFSLEVHYDSLQEWLNNLPFIKSQMDYYYAHIRDLFEKDIQQRIERENNRSPVSNDTDYFVTDIEYEEKSGRFDIIALKLPSTAQDHKNPKASLAIIEVKQGEEALRGTSGLKKHFDDITDCFRNNSDSMLEEAIYIFNLKNELGLVKSTIKRVVNPNKEERPEFIIVAADHKPASTVLNNELKAVYDDVGSSKEYAVKIAKASHMGYGLYIDELVSLEDFLSVK